MKNKRLNITIILLFLILVGTFIQEKRQEETNNLHKNTSSIPTVGVLQFVSHPALDTIYEGIKEGLKENCYDVDQNQVKIAFQNGQADQSKLMIMSQQLIDQKADVLIGIATPAAQSLSNLTKEIPIVLGAVTDPVAAGLIETNEHPGGNITGVSDQAPVIAQIDLAQQLLPDAKRMAILNSSVEDNAVVQAKTAESIAQQKGLEVSTYALPSENEIAQTIQTLKGKVDFIYVPTDNTMANAMQTIVKAANAIHVPVIPAVDTMVEDGGLATVSINQYELGVQTGKMAADILDGKTQPETTPIYIFEEGMIVINQEQMEFFGLTLPEEIQNDVIYVNE